MMQRKTFRGNVPGRVLSMILTIALLLSCMSGAAFAADTPQFYNPDQHQWLYFGWENEWPKAISYMGGGMHPNRNLPMIKYSVSVDGVEYVPDESASDRRQNIAWYQADGYMNSPVSEWTAGGSGIEVKIQHVANRVLDDSATVVFTQVTLTNTTSGEIEAALNVSAAADVEVPIGATEAGTPGDGCTVYSVTVPGEGTAVLDFAALSNGEATVEQLKTLGTFAEQYGAVKDYYDGLLADMAQPTALPDPEVIDAYLNSMIVMQESMVRTVADMGGGIAPVISGVSNLSLDGEAKELETAVTEYQLQELYQNGNGTKHDGLQLNNGLLENVNAGEWISFEKVEFATECRYIGMYFASPESQGFSQGGKVEIYVDDAQEAAAVITFEEDTGDWQAYVPAVAPCTTPIPAGTHKLTLQLKAPDDGNESTFLFNAKGLFSSSIENIPESFTVLGGIRDEKLSEKKTLTMDITADTSNARYELQLVDESGAKVFGTATVEKNGATEGIEIPLSNVEAEQAAFLVYRSEVVDQVYNYEMRGSGGNTCGYYQYDRYFSHDVPNMVEQYIRDGNTELAIRIMESPYYQRLAYEPDQNYLDAIPKYIIPYATLWQVMDDGQRTAYFTDSVKNQIKAAAEMIATYMTGPEGLMAKSNTLDNGSDYLVVDNFAVLHGYAAYRYLCDAWGWTDESAWAQERLEIVNTALNKMLDESMERRGVDWYMCALEDSCGFWQRYENGSVIYDGNWLGTTFMMSTFPWDAVLRGYELRGTWADKLDASLDNAFALRDQRGDIPEDSWGAWWGHEYGAVYNVGMSVGALFSEKYRTLAVNAYEWLLDNQSAPFQWGESFDRGKSSSDWTRPATDLETWGLGFMRQGLLEATASVTTDGDVIIGRGIPNDWLVDGQPIEWKNIRINDGRILTRLSIETDDAQKQIKLTLEGDEAVGSIIFNLPVFVGNIESASAGVIDNERGTVTCDGSTRELVVTLKENAPKPLGQVQLQSAQQSGDNGIELKWEAVDGADGYIVKISDSRETREFTAGGDARSFIWNDAVPHVTYSCTVTAVRGEEAGKESDAKNVTIKLPDRETSAVSAVLTASEPQPGTLDLTQAGQTDWLKTGVENQNQTVQKAGVDLLDYYVLAQSSDSLHLTDSKIVFSWSDGDLIPSSNGTRNANTVGANHGAAITEESPAWMLTVPVTPRDATLELYTNTWNATVRYDVFATDSNQPIATASCTSQGDVSVMKKLTIELKGEALEHTKVLVVATITEKDASVPSGVYGNTSLLGAVMNEVPAQTYPITIGEMTNGTVTADKAEAAEGDTVTLTVTPAEGYRLVSGSLKANDTVVEGNTFTMPAEAVTITAAFEEIPAETYPITIADMTNGTVTADKAEAAEGETVTLTVEPAEGYRLVAGSLKANDAVVEGNSFTMPAEAVTITAAFEKEESGVIWTGPRYVITVRQSVGGSITPGSCVVNEDDSKTFTIQAEEGYEIVDVLVDDESVGVCESYTFQNVSKKHTITAKFQLEDATEEVPHLNFTDVDESDWFYHDVAYAVEKGLMEGTGNGRFQPEAGTTRGMIAAILYREAGSPEVESDGAYWYSDARAWAMETGISDGTNMDGLITREQLAAMLYRYASYKQQDVSARGDLTVFADSASVSGWAAEGMSWAVGEGILSGKNGGRLDPQAGATRAETAAMLARFCELSK